MHEDAEGPAEKHAWALGIFSGAASRWLLTKHVRGTKPAGARQESTATL